MEILLVTGKFAEKQANKVAKKYGCDVLVAPVDVASFLSPEMFGIENVKKKYDLLMVPGTLKIDLEEIEKRTGIKTVLGPTDVSNLSVVLENVDGIELSKTVPADRLLEDLIKKNAHAEIGKADSKKRVKKMLEKEGNFLIGDLPVGRDFPQRVIAEIVNIGALDREELVERARHYGNSGADIIDLGVNEKNPDVVRDAISNLKDLKDLKVPLSIDSMEKENIDAAMDSGIDLILSFDGPILKRYDGIETPSVIIPDRNAVPENTRRRIGLLMDNVKLAERRGFKNIIADPILFPVNFGFTRSIIAYEKLGKYGYPMLMGVGNVTELFDADSAGVNALLCAVASECGVDMVFTTEASKKTRGSVRELSTASKMMYLSKKKCTAPKDLGIDLLVFKEKKRER